MNPWVILGLITAFVGSNAVTGWRAYEIGKEHQLVVQQKAVMEAQEHARAEQAARDRITHDRDVAAAEARQKIETVYRTIIREVPTHVSPAADAACTVPVGFVRVFNAAASGQPIESIPIPAGRTDDSPSGVGLSAVAGVTADNFGTYQQVRQQLIDLQAWVAAQQALR